MPTTIPATVTTTQPITTTQPEVHIETTIAPSTSNVRTSNICVLYHPLAIQNDFKQLIKNANIILPYTLI